jgi:hypothetical protein
VHRTTNNNKTDDCSLLNASVRRQGNKGIDLGRSDNGSATANEITGEDKFALLFVRSNAGVSIVVSQFIPRITADFNQLVHSSLATSDRFTTYTLQVASAVDRGLVDWAIGSLAAERDRRP